MEFNATFIVALLSFVVFILIMNQIYYKPILKIINERKNYIDGNYNSAQNSRDKAAFVLKEKETRINQTIKETKNIVAKKVNEADEAAKSKTNEAKQISQGKIATAKTELEKQEQVISESLKNNVDDLAENISAKILGSEAVTHG